MTRRRRWLGTAAVVAVLVVAAAPFIAPLLWMLSTALKDSASALAYPPRLWPAEPRWSSFSEALDTLSIGLYAWNSTKIAVLATVGQVGSCALAGYAFARMEFAGKRAIFAVLIATLLVPYQVTMVPVFAVMRALGLVDTHAALIVPSFFGGMFGGAAFGTFMLRQFFQSVPRELEDAARIDGASRLRTFWSVMLPLSRPALATLALFVFMGAWNDLLGPVIFLSSREKMTLTVGLAALQANEMQFHYNAIMAGTILSMLPVVALFLLTQRWFVRGMVMSGIKG